MAEPADSINAARDAAEALSAGANDYLQTAEQTSTQWPTGVHVTPTTNPGSFGVKGGAFDWNIFEDVVTPPPFTPTIDLAATFKSDYDSNLASLETWVRGLMTDWMNTYFPTLNPALGVAEDSWLLNVVNNGYSGIPAALELAIWERARAKEMVEAVRLEEEAMMQFSSRGFSMPPGILAGRVLQVQQEAANKSATIARDLAIKQIEIAVDMVKFAIGEITKLRLGIAQALADYIRAWMALPQAASDIAKAKAEMQRVLWNSSADYIRAQVSIAQLDLEAKKSNQANWLRASEINANLDNDKLTREVNTAVAAAQMLGVQASAARGAQNTLVGSISTTAIAAGSA